VTATNKSPSASTNSTQLSKAKSLVKQTAEAHTAGLKTLLASSVVKRHPADLLIQPIPPLEIVPVDLYSGADANQLSVLKQLVASYNSQMLSGAKGLKLPSGSRYITYDTVSLWRDINASASKVSRSPAVLSSLT
jgi:hypothetical protein